MKAYVGHSQGFDFKEELYRPLREGLPSVEFVFPHEKELENSKEVIKSCDVFLAECSIKSLGMGIEVGWADAFGLPVVFIYRKGSKVSASWKYLSDTFIEYEKIEDILDELKEKLV